MVTALERVRAEVHHWLGQIEALARSQSDANQSSAKTDALTRQLQRVESERDQFRMQAQQRELEWQARLEELDQDRRLLADAWERLEREQVECASRGKGHPHPSDVGLAGPSELPMPASSPYVAALAAEEDQAARMAYRQFESLRHDVRLRARAKPSERPR